MCFLLFVIISFTLCDVISGWVVSLAALVSALSCMSLSLNLKVGTSFAALTHSLTALLDSMLNCVMDFHDVDDEDHACSCVASIVLTVLAPSHGLAGMALNGQNWLLDK